MTGQELTDGLVSRLKQLFRGYTLLNKAGALQEVRVFAQYVPQPAGVIVNTVSEEYPEGIKSIDKAKTGLKNYESQDYESNFPCVIVQNKTSKYREERNLQQAIHDIRLLIGVYDDKPECQGWRDIANIHDRIINDLFVDRIINAKFRLEMPSEFNFLEADTWPVYFGELKFTFSIGRPMQHHGYIFQTQGNRL